MADNGPAIARLDDWIRRLRTAGQSLEEAAVEVAAVLKSEVTAAVAEQRGMGGEKWPPTKVGTPALVNAPAHVETRARGRIVQVILSGHDVYHHYGAGRVPRRPIIPTGGMPAKLGKAIAAGIVDVAVAHLMRDRKKARRSRAR